FGAVVTDVTLGSLGDHEFATIEAAFLEFGFLVFPEQFPSNEDSIAFGKRFGKLEFGATSLLSNQDINGDGSAGEILDINSQRMRMIIGNEAWHTDSTYKPFSSKCAMLSAVVIPEEGGGTALADTRSGYAALDPATKDRIANLSAYHSNQYSQANDVGDFPIEQADTIYHGEAYLRPLVKTHPQTGVKNLLIGRHAFGIPGLTREESRELLQSLMDFVISDEARVYEHNYRPGDLLFWDNRALLHRALPYDYTKPRIVIGTRVAGEETEFAYNPSDREAEAGRQALADELALLHEETNDRLYKATTASSGKAAF
ncbi:MAG: TauD/TfdA family dioxygenase, partial [Alphaproteobacteria bacterium]|nr:TauD/TfdA family dioxygenase [Alphaproteobacteria bacterium]